MRHCLVRVALIVLVLFSLPMTTVCRADTAYRWTDDEGKIVFGSKPPAGARNVAPVTAKNFSRYSPSKVLAKRVSENVKSEGRGRLNSVKEKNIVIAPAKETSALEKTTSEKTTDEAIPNDSAVELSVEPASVKVGSLGEIISCLTTVKNKTQLDVDGVQVSFEFPDGSLLPADGPSRLNAKQGAVYSIRAESLPVKLAAGTKPTAKVLVNTDADAKMTEEQK